jgi:hypothetical protein
MRTKLGMLAMALVLSVSLFGCTALVREPALPPWAPAHGHPAKHQYNYYPESAVYYDTAQKRFFYYNGEQWITTTLLPDTVVVDWKSYVVLKTDTDKPYIYHAAVVKRYPPGYLKRLDKHKEKKRD